MATEKAPAYQWFVKDWRSSRATIRMSFAERGIYREMLDEQWEALTLPDSAEEVASLIASTDAQHAEVLAAWTVVRRKFVEAEGQPGRIVNARLERVRKERRRFVRIAQKGGRARAEQAARNESGVFQPRASHKPADTPATTPAVQPAAEPAPIQASASTASASSSASSSATATASAYSARRAAGAPPLALGLRRIKVWRWMLDDCIAALGEHAESFDIEAWLQALDARENRVIPDVWPWLKTELLAEARRRGLAAVETSDRKPIFTQSSKEMGEAVLANLHRETGLPR